MITGTKALIMGATMIILAHLVAIGEGEKFIGFVCGYVLFIYGWCRKD